MFLNKDSIKNVNKCENILLLNKDSINDINM